MSITLPLLSRLEGGVALIELNRPEAANRPSASLAAAYDGQTIAARVAATLNRRGGEA